MVSLQPNNLRLITHSTSGAYCEKVSNSQGVWETHSPYSWDPIPGLGNLITEPVVCKYGADIVVFGLDTDRKLKYNWYDGSAGKWSEEALTPGSDNNRYLSKPATVGSPHPTAWLGITILGEDRSLYDGGCDGSIGSRRWNPITRLESNILFAQPPVVAAWNNNQKDIFCVGVDGKLYRTFWNRYSGWSRKDGALYEDLSDGLLVDSQVQVITRGEGYFDLLVVGRDSKLHHRAFGNGQWGRWEVVDGTETYRGTPELVSFEKNRVDAFAIGHLGHVRHLILQYGNDGIDAKEWEVFEKVAAGPTNFDRPTAVSREYGKIDLAVVYSWKGGIQHRWYSKTDGWQPASENPLGDFIYGSCLSRVGTAS